MLSTASGHRFILRAHKCIITCCTVLRRQNKWGLTIPGTFCIYSGPQFCIKSSPILSEDGAAEQRGWKSFRYPGPPGRVDDSFAHGADMLWSLLIDYVVLYMFYDIFYSQSCITLAVRLVESGALKCFVHAEHIAAAGAYRAHGNDGPRSARDSGSTPHCA